MDWLDILAFVAMDSLRVLPHVLGGSKCLKVWGCVGTTGGEEGSLLLETEWVISPCCARTDIGPITSLWSWTTRRKEVTDVVRGADLLSATACHLALQQALHFNEPHYMHVEVVVNEQGQKLSKQTLAAPVELRDAPSVMQQVMMHLGLGAMDVAPVKDMLAEGKRRWGEKHLK